MTDHTHPAATGSVREAFSRQTPDDVIREIYKREGWDRHDKGGFPTCSARCNSLYIITADPRRNRYHATPIAAAPTPDAAASEAGVVDGGHADTEGEAMAMFAHLNCPCCGGSGHVDDCATTPAAAPKVASDTDAAASEAERREAVDRVKSYIAELLLALQPFASAAERADAENAASEGPASYGPRAYPWNYVNANHFADAFEIYSDRLAHDDLAALTTQGGAER